MLSIGLAVVLGMLLQGATSLPAKTNTYPGFSGIKYIFSFGDSYTQTDFNSTNGQPLPTAANPMGNPPYPGYTASDGPNWIDYITTTYNKSVVQTWNFAYGGATIDSALVTPYLPTVLSVKQQVQNLFLPQIAQKPASAPWTSDNTLFTFFIGINDIGNTYGSGKDLNSFYGTEMDTYFGLVQQIYNAGGRNFLFLNVPPIQRSPLTVGQGSNAVSQETTALSIYNNLLTSRVASLKSANSGVWAQVFDTASVFNQILNSPSSYGFANSTSFCNSYISGTPAVNTFYSECGVPVNEYFWLNDLHPTWPVHKVLAQQLAETLDGANVIGRGTRDVPMFDVLFSMWDDYGFGRLQKQLMAFNISGVL